MSDTAVMDIILIPASPEIFHTLIGDTEKDTVSVWYAVIRFARYVSHHEFTLPIMLQVPFPDGSDIMIR